MRLRFATLTIRARPALLRAGAGRALAHANGAADRGLRPRRQSGRIGAAARGKIHQHVRQALHRRERARRRRHCRRQHGRQVAARRSCADVRRFRRDGDQSGAQPSLGYDPIKDFAPVTALVSLPTILSANPTVPANTLAEFIALAKKDARQDELRLGRRRLDPSSDHGDLRRPHRHRPAPCALSRRLGDGERAADRRDPGRLVRHPQRHGADRERQAARLLHQRAAALAVDAVDSDLRRARPEGLRRRDGDGAARPRRHLAEGGRAPAGGSRRRRCASRRWRRA